MVSGSNAGSSHTRAHAHPGGAHLGLDRVSSLFPRVKPPAGVEPAGLSSLQHLSLQPGSPRPRGRGKPARPFMFGELEGLVS